MTNSLNNSETKMQYQIIIDDEVRKQAAQAVAQKKLLNLKNDVVFKSFFSKDCVESEYCRKKMLSAVIGKTVTDTKILNPEILPTRMDGKFPRLDIHCKLDDNSELEVEMQNSMYQDDQIKRSIYYAAALTHNALSRGDDYAFLPHIYQIQFVDFNIVNDTRLHHSYTYKEKEDNRELSDIVQIHYIELPKIEEILEKQPEDLSEIEFWAMFIMSYEKPKVWKLLSTLTARQKELNMAQALLNTMSHDQQEWENQIGYERFVRDCISRENNAYRKGEIQGIQQGASQKAIEAAENLLRMGVNTVEQISQAIGLPLEKVQELAENILVNS
ncbi:MAG: Rpn family recombination-promoting nuclease/putative transposase [Treponema sp.]|nr:Rpn family recombination-promoting nuclease/putative transposase [Treponema sp.]